MVFDKEQGRYLMSLRSAYSRKARTTQKGSLSKIKERKEASNQTLKARTHTYLKNTENIYWHENLFTIAKKERYTKYLLVNNEWTRCGLYTKQGILGYKGMKTIHRERM